MKRQDCILFLIVALSACSLLPQPGTAQLNGNDAVTQITATTSIVLTTRTTTSQITRLYTTNTTITSELASQSVQTVTSTSTSMLSTTISGLITTILTATITTSSTNGASVVIDILATGPGEVFVLILSIVAVGCAAQRMRKRPIRKRGIVCIKCGHMNPAFARSFCVNCAEPLSNGR